MKAEDIVRLSLDPLWRVAGRPGDAEAFARVLGVPRRSVERWIDRQGVPFDRADGLAVSLGLHPMSIWGDEWYRAEVEDLGKKERQRVQRNARNQVYRRAREARRRLERCTTEAIGS